MEHPTLVELEKLAKQNEPRPIGFNIGLEPNAIFAVGMITLQWAALYETVLLRIAFLRSHPNLPEDLRARKPDHRQETNITYLRDLGSYAYAVAPREGAAALFDRTICHIFAFKADRDKLAHGTFALQDNQDFDGIVGSYKGRQFHLTAKRIAAVAEGISRCNAFLLIEFENWLHAAQHAQALRSLLEISEQQDRPDTSRL